MSIDASKLVAFFTNLRVRPKVVALEVANDISLKQTATAIGATTGFLVGSILSLPLVMLSVKLIAIALPGIALSTLVFAVIGRLFWRMLVGSHPAFGSSLVYEEYRTSLAAIEQSGLSTGLKDAARGEALRAYLEAQMALRGEQGQWRVAALEAKADRRSSDNPLPPYLRPAFSEDEGGASASVGARPIKTPIPPHQKRVASEHVDEPDDEPPAQRKPV